MQLDHAKRKKLIEKSIKKYSIQLFLLLGAFAVINILNLFLGIRYIVVKGSYLELPGGDMTEIFVSVAIFSAIAGWAVKRYKGGDTAIKEHIIWEAEKTGKPLRDRSLAFPVMLEFSTFTGLLDLFHNQQWQLFAVTQATAMLAIIISAAEVQSWRFLVKRLYLEIPEKEFEEE